MIINKLEGKFLAKPFVGQHEPLIGNNINTLKYVKYVLTMNLQ